MQKWSPSWIFKWPIGQILSKAPIEHLLKMSCLNHNLHDSYQILLLSAALCLYLFIVIATVLWELSLIVRDWIQYIA